MYLIAEQPYVTVQREITSNEQKDIEYKHIIYLYNERVVTQHHEFPLWEIIDISYRLIGGEIGLLYLHTKQGVYAFTVKSSPRKFIAAFKKQINK